MATYHLKHLAQSELPSGHMHGEGMSLHYSLQHRVQLKKNTLGELNTTEKKNVRQREGTHMSDNFEKLIF